MNKNTKYGVVAALTLAAFVAPSAGAYTKDSDGNYVFNNNEKAHVAKCIRDELKVADAVYSAADIVVSTVYATDDSEDGKVKITKDGTALETVFEYGDDKDLNKDAATEAAEAEIVKLKAAEAETIYNSKLDKCVKDLTDSAKIYDDIVDGGSAAGKTDDLKKDVDDAKANIKNAEKAVTTAERAVTKAETNVARAQAKYDNAVAAAKAKNPDYTDAEIAAMSTVSSAKDKLDDAQTKLEVAQLNLQDAKDDLADAQDAKTEAEQALADNKAEIAANELEFAEKKLSDAQEKLDEANDSLDIKKEALADAQAELDDAKADLADAKAELRAAKKTDSNYSKLEKDVEDAEKKVQSKQSIVDSAKNEVKEAEAAVKTEEKKVAAAQKLVSEKQAAADKAEEAAKTSIASATISGVAKAYTYNGNAYAPAVTVKLGDTTLAAGTDYTVSYSNNKEVGTATITVKGAGAYAGTATKTFYIDPAKSSIKKVSVGAKKMTVTVKKGTKASGVQIAYRAKGTSKWSYVKTTSTSKTIKSLKKGKKYQIIVRSYTTKSGKVTNYSGWSATKTTAAVK